MIDYFIFFLAQPNANAAPLLSLLQQTNEQAKPLTRGDVAALHHTIETLAAQWVRAIEPAQLERTVRTLVFCADYFRPSLASAKATDELFAQFHFEASVWLPTDW